jgi:hypothetical protein
MPEVVVDPIFLNHQISRRACRESARRAEALGLIPEAKRVPLTDGDWCVHRVCVPTLRLDALSASLQRELGWVLDVREEAPIELMCDVVEYLPIEDLAAALAVLSAAQTEWDEAIRDYDRTSFEKILEPVAGSALPWLRAVVPRLRRVFLGARPATSTSVPFLKLLLRNPGPLTEVGVLAVQPAAGAAPIEVAYLRRPYTASAEFPRARVAMPGGDLATPPWAD